MLCCAVSHDVAHMFSKNSAGNQDGRGRNWLVYLVYLVCLVGRIGTNQRNQIDQRDNMNKTDVHVP